MDILSILGDTATGGLLGMLGNVIDSGISYFKSRQEHKQKLEWAIQERETLRLQVDLAAAQTAGNIVEFREKGAADAFTESIKAEAALSTQKMSRWVTDIRGITRPALTVLCLFISSLMYFFPPTSEAQNFISTNMIVMTFTIISWWFGQRSMEKLSVTWGNKSAGASVNSKQ